MEQGTVFRLHLKDSVLEPVSLNPFGTGQCLSTSKNLLNVFISKGLNPFGTGQCLSTRCAFFLYLILRVSIPLEQGNVFRQKIYTIANNWLKSQSLWNRAVSFDCSGMLEAGVMRPFRPTSQFFGKVKELALNLSK